MDRVLDFRRMSLNVGPSGGEIGWLETGIILEQLSVRHSMSAGILKHPDGNASVPDACLPTTDPWSALDERARVPGFYEQYKVEHLDLNQLWRRFDFMEQLLCENAHI